VRQGRRDRPLAGAGRRFLAAVGDVNSPVTWGGIPYHFLQAGQAAGLFDEGLPLAVDGPLWRLRRYGWNAQRVLAGDRRGGYQYSVPFLETLWAPHRARVRGGLVFNCFQLYPPSLVEDGSVQKWFFVDQTLRQLFGYYGQSSSVGRRIAAEAIARERAGYQAAAGVVAHSHWTARSVVEDYDVPSSRVHVVVPGANLDRRAYERWERGQGRCRPAGLGSLREGRPLRFVFVGKDWYRKGLDRLLAGFALAVQGGASALLRIIGCERERLPPHLRGVPGVEWCGFVDKGQDASRFIRLVAESDVGCLLSRAEAGGIVQREYHALGLAVLGTTAGGAPEHACAAASRLLDPQAPVEVVARTLLDIASDPAWLAQMRANLWDRRRSFLYPAAVEQVLELVSR